MKRRIALFVFLWALVFQGFAKENKIVPESKIVKTLENNSKLEIIKTEIPLDDFSISTKGEVSFGKYIASEKFSIRTDLKPDMLKERLNAANQSRFVIELQLISKKPKVYNLVKINGLETYEEYCERLEKLELSNQRARNKLNGFGEFTDEELTLQKSKNLTSGLGEIFDIEVELQTKKNADCGFGSFTDFQLEVQKNENEKNGLGFIIDEVVKNQKEKNENNGLGAFTDYQLTVQRNNNREKGFGEFSDFELESQKKKNSSLGYGEILDSQITENYFRENKKFFLLLNFYTDQYASNPTDENKNKLVEFAQIIIQGNPGLDEYDDFSRYDGWVEFCQEFVDYWSKNTTYELTAVKASKINLNVSDKTYKYKFDFKLKNTEKYNFQLDVVRKGLNGIVSLYSNFPGDFDSYGLIGFKPSDYVKGGWSSSVDKYGYIISHGIYGIQFIITDLNGNQISKNAGYIPYTSRGEPNPYLYLDVEAAELVNSEKFKIVLTYVSIYDPSAY